MALYSALLNSKTFRLLEVLSGSENEALSCRLVPASLSIITSYEAISYTWGDVNDRVEILCNDLAVSITRNLAEALRRFRSTHKERVVWADGLCINQEDVTEREQEVRIMGDIYKNCENVLVWLGPASAGLTSAIPLLYELIQQISNHESLLETALKQSPAYTDTSSSPRRALLHSYEWSDFGMRPPAAEEYAIIERFFQLPWYSRAWTFQESYLAKKKILYHGPHEIDADLITALSFKLYTIGKLVGPKFRLISNRTLVMLMGEKMAGDKLDSLCQLLRSQRGSGCRDSRDLVYSLLGSVKDAASIEVDYTKSIEDLLIEVTLHEINRTGDLGVLRDVTSNSNLPTWVADWRVEKSGLVITNDTVRYYDCSAGSKVQCSYTTNTRQLDVKGWSFDTIKYVAEQCVELSHTARMHAQDDEGRYKHSGELFDLATLRTFMLDCNGGDPRHGRTRWDVELYHAIEDLGAHQIRQGMIDTFSSSDTLLFVTEDGRIGASALQVLPGDTICIMLGGEVPLVLRPQADAYMFISECYLHGYMDGEAMRELCASSADTGPHLADPKGLQDASTNLILQTFSLR